jgi:hypothetical protein
MKLTKGFVTHETMGEQIMVGAGKTNFSGLVRSNETAALIVDCLKTETTKEEILDKLLAEYDVSRQQAEQDLEGILTKLRSLGALTE